MGILLPEVPISSLQTDGQTKAENELERDIEELQRMERTTTVWLMSQKGIPSERARPEPVVSQPTDAVHSNAHRSATITPKQPEPNPKKSVTWDERPTIIRSTDHTLIKALVECKAIMEAILAGKRPTLRRLRPTLLYSALLYERPTSRRSMEHA